MSKILQTIYRGIFVLIAVLALCTGGVAAAQIQAALGSVVTLQGYSSAGDTVCLFLTGPNLLPNGVALTNINQPAEMGGGTRVSVDSNGHWEYKWGTGSAGGRLDAGVYTVWIADGPADLSHLSTVGYSTIPVLLGVPSVTAGISGGSGGSRAPVTPGSIELRSIPGEASVVINNEYKGVAPLTVSGLDPGTYNVTLSRFGYRPISAPIEVEPGSVSQVNITLPILTGALSVNSSPSGAEITVDGARTGISPMTFTSLQQGNHTLNVTKDGYIPQILPVHVAADQTTRIDLTLAPLSRVGGGARAPGMLPATLGAEIIVTLLLVIGRNRR
jgi:hypothetical protein